MKTRLAIACFLLLAGASAALLAGASAAVLAGAGAVAQAPDTGIAAQPVATLYGKAATVALHPIHGAVLVLGFSRESNAQTREWSERAGAALRASSTGSADAVPLINVVVLTGAPGLIQRLVRRGIRRSVPEEHHRTFYVVEDDDTFWRALADVDGDETAYVLRLAPTGRVCTRHVGPVNDQALDEMLKAGCPGTADGPQ